MTYATAEQQTSYRRFSGRRLWALLIAVVAAAGLAMPAAPAEGGSYSVVACDAAAFFGSVNKSWSIVPGPGGFAYSDCPSGGGSTRGVSNRHTSGTVGYGFYSAHDFRAPAGTTITRLRWAGRLARNNCGWRASIDAYPAGAIVIGAPQNSYCSTTAFDTGPTPFAFTPPSGTTHLRQHILCGRSSCAPGATIHSRFLEVTLADWWIPQVSLGGALASGQWVRGAQGVRVNASDNVGIRRVEASILGTQPAAGELGCNPTLARPCPTTISRDLSLETEPLSDGRHTLRTVARDYSGNATVTDRYVRVDNEPPAPPPVSLADGDGWRSQNSFSLSWVNPPAQHAPIVRARWEACRSGRCFLGSRQGDDVSALGNLVVSQAGDYSFRVWLEDAAGNQRRDLASRPVHLRFDPVAPTLTIDATDPTDPLRVSALARDQHSGVAGGEIEMRQLGTRTWHSLDTRLTGSRLVSYVDDERFRNGAYEFRARATDRAGNEVSTDRRRDGAAATLRLPVRSPTRLRVGRVLTRTVRRVVRRNGRRQVVRRRIRVRDARVTARLGSKVRLSGVLTNFDGQPLPGAAVQVTGARSGVQAFLATVETDASGRFTYIAKATTNRGIAFSYRGSRLIGAASARVDLVVPAASTIEVDRATARNGDTVTFSGRVRSRPVPRTGKLVEVQAYFRGRWRTFSTVRTDSRGRWQFPYGFGGTTGRIRYRFRVLLPVEGGYPFANGYSRRIIVVVTGP